MWPDICNIFSHFHCWLVVPPPSWSSGALCTVLLSSCALCPCPLVHCASVHCALCTVLLPPPPPGPHGGGIPERKTWQTTLSQLFSSSELFAHFVNVISVEDGSHPVLKKKSALIWDIRVHPTRNVFLDCQNKQTEKQLFSTYARNKQTNRTNNFVFNIWNHRLCALTGERTSSLGEGRGDLLMESRRTGICHI